MALNSRFKIKEDAFALAGAVSNLVRENELNVALINNLAEQINEFGCDSMSKEDFIRNCQQAISLHETVVDLEG